MAFDGIVMAAVRKELADKLTGGRIEKIYQPEKSEVILHVHSQGAKYRLLLSAHPQDARVHLTTAVRENPTTPPMFCMILRKHIEGGRIKSITQPELERVLHIAVEAYDELGELSEKVLIAEIMGKHSNLILTDSGGLILDGIKRYSHGLSRHREVLPGRKYIAPPEQDKINPLKLTEAAFREKLMAASLEAKVAKSLLNNLSGISPLISREIVARANLPEELRTQDCGDYELNQLWQSLSSVIAIVHTASFTPAVYFEGEKPVAFSALQLTQYAGLKETTGTISEVLDLFFGVRINADTLKQQQNYLLKIIGDEIDRNLKKIALQEEALAEASKAEEYKIMGELLTANLHLTRDGQQEIEVVNYYDPSGGTVVISLDPQLSPAGNAQDYFRKYNKAKSTIQNADEQKAIALNELNYLESVKQSLLMAADKEEIKEIREELAAGNYVKAKPVKNPKHKKDSRLPSKPHSFISSDGLDILVGKNNRQNDLLTMKMAQDNDTWLHVKDIPGSHVIIRNNGRPFPDDTLLEAAMLAAYFSKARESANVPVDYTLKKYVHKPRGAKPGMVIYTDQHTVFVTPEAKLADNLQKKAES